VYESIPRGETIGMQSQNDVRIATLLDAYFSADYRWELDRDWRLLGIGRRAPEIEAAFPDSTSFGLLSAWDPYSMPRPEAVNRAADEALHTALLASGLPFRPGFSSAPNRSWREPSWVVMDMPEDEFDRLAQRFGQLGTLRWNRGEPIRLRMYARRPVHSAQRECVDWVELPPVETAPTGVRDKLNR
jgi:hypothetical protein